MKPQISTDTRRSSWKRETSDNTLFLSVFISPDLSMSRGQRLILFSLSFLFLNIGIISVEAKNDAGWTQFCGTNGQLIAKDAKPPLTWSETNNIAWKVEMPDRGRSSPVVKGDKIWLTAGSYETDVRQPVSLMFFQGNGLEAPRSLLSAGGP